MRKPMRVFVSPVGLALFVLFIAFLTGPDAHRSGLAATLKPRVSGPSARPQAAEDRLPLSLAQSVLVAVQNNIDVKVERLTPLIGVEEVQRELAVFFSPRLNAEINTDRTQRPAGSILAGAQVLESQNVDVNTGVSMRSVTGGLVSLDLRNKRFTSNSAFQLFDPQYTAELALTLTHPLLKNFGIDLNRTRINLAQNAASISKHHLKAVIANLITTVQQAYWDVVLANGDLAARRQALQVAQHLHRRSEEFVARGRLPAIAEMQARVGLMEREIELTASENTLQDAQQRLKALLNLEGIAEAQDLVIVPTDAPQVSWENISVDEGLEGALAKRPELFQAQLDVANKQLGARFAENQTLPEVNFIGGVGLNGLSGTPTPTPLSSFTIGGVPLDRFFTNGQDLSSFKGGYEDALGKLFSGDFLSYKVGVMIHIPLSNVVARSDLAKAKLELEKAKLSLQNLQQKIALEVERVARAVTNAWKAIEGATSLRQLAERQLDLAQEGLELGVSSVTDVLEAQKRVTLARRDELRAIIEYNKLLALWESVTGRSLERFHITI